MASITQVMPLDLIGSILSLTKPLVNLAAADSDAHAWRPKLGVVSRWGGGPYGFEKNGNTTEEVQKETHHTAEAASRVAVMLLPHVNQSLLRYVQTQQFPQSVAHMLAGRCTAGKSHASPAKAKTLEYLSVPEREGPTPRLWLLRSSSDLAEISVQRVHALALPVRPVLQLEGLLLR